MFHFPSHHHTGSLRHHLIINFLRRIGPSTDRQVMAGLGFTDPNAVRPRITELLDDGVLRESSLAICPVTGRTVRVVAHPFNMFRPLHIVVALRDSASGNYFAGERAMVLQVNQHTGTMRVIRKGKDMWVSCAKWDVIK